MGNAVVLLLAMRFSGLDAATVPLATALLACGYLMVVNILPIPGKSALAAPTLFTIMSLTSDAEQSAMTAAILLYRVVTWLLPMPVGAAMFFVWRYRVRRDTVTTVPEDPDVITPPLQPDPQRDAALRYRATPSGTKTASRTRHHRTEASTGFCSGQ